MKRLEPMWDGEEFPLPAEHVQADDYDGHNLFRGLIVAIGGTVFLVAAVTGVIVVAVR